MTPLFSSTFTGVPDIVGVRRAARCITRSLGFDYQEQIRITTGVSELVRAAFGDSGGPVAIKLGVRRAADVPELIVEVSGPGLAPSSAAGESAVAAEKLLDRFVRIPVDDPRARRLARPLQKGAPPLTAVRISAIRAELAPLGAGASEMYREEIDRQTQDLARALLELQGKQQELARLNAELGDTNRGVMALYAELDDRANHLRRADELKSRFFSYISHEFRTPLSSIVALGRLLLDGADGTLSDEQARQVRLIRDSAGELLDLVSDLLDLAKADAGKADLTLTRFSLGPLFGALRGMIRPLLAASDVRLELAGVENVPPLVSDEGKIAQILRNFLSNAVKFTERGSITVTARAIPAGAQPAEGRERVRDDSVLFCVVDTGIGIAAEDQETIFDEFAQVRHGLQPRVRGTGLGLSLCRRLASLLGGEVWVTSEVGRGSSFYCLLPRIHPDASIEGESPIESRAPLLLVTDSAERRNALENLFADTAFGAVAITPAEVTDARIREIAPVLAVTDAAEKDDGHVERLRHAGVPALPAPAGTDGAASFVQTAYRAATSGRLGRFLVLDDDRRFLAILAKSLEPFGAEVVTTDDPHAALRIAAAGGIDCAFVDLMMPEMDGIEVLARLRESALTEALPIVICSSKALTGDERALLRRLHTSFVAKDDLSLERLEAGVLEAQVSAAAVRRSALLTDTPMDG